MGSGGQMFERSEFLPALKMSAPRREPAVARRAMAGKEFGRPSFGYFSWPSRKVIRPAGDPAGFLRSSNHNQKQNPGVAAPDAAQPFARPKGWIPKGAPNELACCAGPLRYADVSGPFTCASLRLTASPETSTSLRRSQRGNLIRSICDICVICG